MRPLERREQGAALLGGEDAQADDGLAADWVGLLRHRRGRTPEVTTLLAHLPDLRAGKLDHLPRQLAAGPRRRSEHEAHLRDGVACGMPGDVDDPESEPLRHPMADGAAL